MAAHLCILMAYLPAEVLETFEAQLDQIRTWGHFRSFFSFFVLLGAGGAQPLHVIDARMQRVLTSRAAAVYGRLVVLVPSVVWPLRES